LKIQVLGTCCPKCKRLVELVDEVVSELGPGYEVENDGEVKSSGKLLTPDEIRELIQG